MLHIVGGLPTEDRPHLQPFILSQINSLIKSGINIEVLDLKGYESIFNYLNSGRLIRKIVHEKKIQLIHAHYVYCGLTALLAGTKLPTILSLMGSDLLGSPNHKGEITLRGKIDGSLSKFISKFVDVIIVKSKGMKKQLKVKKQIEVIPNGVDFNIFKPQEKKKSREDLNLSTEDFLILFLGNPDLYRKNLALTKAAVDELKNMPGINNVKLIVPFGTPHNDVVKYMNASDVLLLTSYWEGSPNVIKEGMACNLPIVSTDVGDVREIISDAKNCFIVPFDSQAIADKLKIIYENKGRSNGRDKIEHLKDDKIADKIIKIYKRLV